MCFARRNITANFGKPKVTLNKTLQTTTGAYNETLKYLKIENFLKFLN